MSFVGTDFNDLSSIHPPNSDPSNMWIHASDHTTQMSELISESVPNLKVKVKSLSHARLFATPWTVAHQAPPSMGFSRQEYWSELPFPSPGDLPNPGIEPRSPALQAEVLTSEPPGKPFKSEVSSKYYLNYRWNFWYSSSLNIIPL